MRQGIPIMLTGDALSIYTLNVSSTETYNEKMNSLRSWFSSDEKKARILTSFQELRLSEGMQNNPERSEISVFPSFSMKLSKLQKQLDTHYQHDDILRDQLIIAVDHKEIQKSLREIVPKSSQDATNRISTFLSDLPKSASDFKMNNNGDSSALYGLGTRYDGNSSHRKYQYNNSRPDQNR